MQADAFVVLRVERGGKLTVGNIATKEDPKYWSSDVTAIRWNVRWTQKGLQPIKPRVSASKKLTIPGGRALPIAV